MNENNTPEDFNATKNSEPAYYAILTADVRYCKDLEPNAKLLYAEITALCNKTGYCWSTNKYFADLYDVDIRTIQRWLESLSKNSFIYIDHDQKKFGSMRRIFLSEKNKINFTERQKCHGGVTEMSGGGDKNVTHNNTSNTTSKKRTLSTLSNETPFETPKSHSCVSFFSDFIKEKDPAFELSKSEHANWVKDLQAMHEIDDRSWEEIQALIQYSQEHEWWPSRSNTPKKLRKHATTILTQMKTQPIKDKEESDEKVRLALIDKNSDTARRLVKGIPQKYYQILSDFIRIDFPGSHFSIDFDDPDFENKIYLATTNIKRQL